MIYISALMQSPLFWGTASEEELKTLLSTVHYQVKKYDEGEVIAFSGDECKSLQIVIEGSVRGEMMDLNGKVLKIEDIVPPRPLAIAFLFGNNNRYPVTVTANEPTVILLFPKQSVIDLMQKNAGFLTSFMNAVSNRAQFISGKLKFLSFQSLRGKIAHYLLELDRHEKGVVTLTKTQEELAELFGVARPSLSRALRELHNEGIIKAEGKNIKIIKRVVLKEYLGK
ncbi:Crp/Fnr family transcriptional regulator [Alkalitalea saponilacus]|uniref:cAMP-binding domain of CRP or a regulatory subunit of cAMP-dependent protein kinases n=1 Tax=Alkalitalea saponilacus TaxID=889453 RepID=A0A1T5H8G3_9BACT|nr:Crp/Fnr family transcriptional regulator [Alkalitalea saponilacus]ASB51209.1 cAMP-binding protein [Alkalitalea saponilacus]SKC16957.1 cAMP-binding domain of CRP or a regulatory subunit of cAMP-dependent protein kinases [Alkalitalea saponilacus]